jgi:hypothetical protein
MNRIRRPQKFAKETTVLAERGPHPYDPEFCPLPAVRRSQQAYLRHGEQGQ